MVLLKCLEIHSRPVIISFRKTDRYDLHQILVSPIILSQKDQMVITILPVARLALQARIRCHIHLAADDRVDFCLIKLDHTVHHTVIRDRRTVHAKFLDAGYIFFYFVGTI